MKHVADTHPDAFKYGTVLACPISFIFPPTSAPSSFPPLIQVVARVDGKPSCCQCIGPGCSRRVAFSTE